MELDPFPRTDIDHRAAARFDCFPPDLIGAAGSLGIGIEVSRYHAFARVQFGRSPDEARVPILVT